MKKKHLMILVVSFIIFASCTAQQEVPLENARSVNQAEKSMVQENNIESFEESYKQESSIESSEGSEESSESSTCKPNNPIEFSKWKPEEFILLEYPMSENDFTALAPEVAFQSIDFSLPTDELVYDSCWLDDNTLILMSLLVNDENTAWENAESDNWKFYTAKLDTGIVIPSTKEEIQQVRNICLSFPRMYADYTSSIWGFPTPTFPTSLYSGTSHSYNTTGTVYNLDYSMMAERRNYQYGDSFESASYDIVVTDILTGIETIIFSGFARYAMESPYGLMLLGFTENDQYIIYQNHSEISVDAGRSGLIDISTGEIIPDENNQVVNFVPTMSNTAWVTNLSGPPGGYGRFDQNGIKNIITGEYRSIDPIAAYYEYTRIPATDICNHARVFHLARETPTLICHFEDENGIHIFLFDIPTGTVTALVSGEKGVETGMYGASLSSSQQNLAFCVRIACDDLEEENTQRLLVYKS